LANMTYPMTFANVLKKLLPNTFVQSIPVELNTSPPLPLIES